MRCIGLGYQLICDWSDMRIPGQSLLTVSHQLICDWSLLTSALLQAGCMALACAAQGWPYAYAK